MFTMRHFMFDMSFRSRKNRVSRLTCRVSCSICCLRIPTADRGNEIKAGNPHRRVRFIAPFPETPSHSGAMNRTLRLRLIPGPRSSLTSCAGARGIPRGDCTQFYTPLLRKCQEKNHRSAQLSPVKPRRTGRHCQGSLREPGRLCRLRRSGPAVADWPIMIVRSAEAERWAGMTWYADTLSLVGNKGHPCMHADPFFP